MFGNEHCYFHLTSLLRNAELWSENNTKLNETEFLLSGNDDGESLLQISKLQSKKEKTRFLSYVGVSKVLWECRGGVERN